jgi:arginine N-succinyltransferase
MSRYEIRGAVQGDEEALLALARELNTVNLPNDRPHIQRLLLDNQRSFAEQVPQNRRKYVFILWDRETGRAVGTSMIIAQLGRRGAPYIYFDVQKEERYAASVDKHFHHQLLRIQFSYDGPTEIGGLVVAPDYRKAPERLGLLISYVRFLFIATHRKLFRDELLAELLPPLEPDGTSHLWEAVGRRFTEMSYAEADLLSSENKDFIRDLFPRDSIYVTLIAPDARAVIGQVGAQTKGVEKMLRRVGFRYVNRVDPFDGGPHFTAATEEVTLVKATRTCVVGEPLPEHAAGARYLVARDVDGPPFFHAVDSRATVDADGRGDDANATYVIRLPEMAANALGLKVGDRAHCLPLH